VPILPLLSGITLLVAGRRLFWLIVAVLGFMVGYQFVQDQFPTMRQETVLIVGIVLGIGGAILAVFIQKLGIAIAGFLAGGLIGSSLWQWLGNTGDSTLLVFLIAGVIGCFVMMLLFEWALVIMTSLAGAGLLIQSFEAENQGLAGLLFLGLTLFGIFVQSWHSPAKKRQRE